MEEQIGVGTLRCFFRRREHGLEVGGFALGSEELYADFVETGVLEPLAEVDFAEAEPIVAVQFARLVELMLVEVENDEASARFEELGGGGNGLRGIDGVMQRLAQDGEIDGARFDGRFREIAEAIFDVGDFLLFKFSAREGDHLRRIIDGDDLRRILREQLREPTFACAEIGDNDARDKLCEQRPNFRPGAARTKAFSESTGDAVEVFASRGAAFFEDDFTRGAVFGGVGNFFQRAFGGIKQLACFDREAFGEGIVGMLAFAAGFDEPCRAQDTEVGGDARLAEVEDFLQFRDGEFLVL